MRKCSLPKGGNVHDIQCNKMALLQSNNKAKIRPHPAKIIIFDNREKARKYPPPSISTCLTARTQGSSLCIFITWLVYFLIFLCQLLWYFYMHHKEAVEAPVRSRRSSVGDAQVLHQFLVVGRHGNGLLKPAVWSQLKHSRDLEDGAVGSVTVWCEKSI